MFNLFTQKKQSALGVDISTSSVKLLELLPVGDSYRIEGYGITSLPDNVMEGRRIKDVDAVAQTIRELISSLRISTKRAAVAVSDSLAISKVIQVNDGLSEAEIEELVLMDADKYIPYPIDEINLDFSVLGPSSKNTAMLDILLVASRSEYVTDRVNVLIKAGLDATVVDVESYSVERVLNQYSSILSQSGEKKITAIIDLGSIYTHLFILQGTKIIFSREEEFGGKQLIDSIVERYGIKAIDVVNAIEHGTLPSEFDKEVLQPFKESILLQVKRSLQFFFSTSQHTFVDRLFLAGGVAKMAGIATMMEEYVGIPTQTINPFTDMDLSNKVDRELLLKDAPSLVVAFGLALRAAL